MDDLKEMFEGSFKSPIGLRVKYLSIIVHKNGEFVFPSIMWLNTDDSIWHRIFSDVWAPHWDEFTFEEKRDVMEEDFDEGEYFGQHYFVIDLMQEYKLQDLVIKNAGMLYDEQNQLGRGVLSIQMENNKEVAIHDFGDFIDTQLIVNGNRI